MKKEASENFLTDPQKRRTTLRPTYVLIYGWIGGKNACEDLTEVYPLMGAWESLFWHQHDFILLSLTPLIF